MENFAYVDPETGKLPFWKKIVYAAPSLPSISVPNVLVGSFGESVFALNCSP